MLCGAFCFRALFGVELFVLSWFGVVCVVLVVFGWRGSICLVLVCLCCVLFGVELFVLCDRFDLA